MEKNSHIQCTVQQCKHNNACCNLCSLDVIRIGTHEQNPTMAECTDCKTGMPEAEPMLRFPLFILYKKIT